MLVVDTNILVYAADAGHRRATWLSGNLIHGMHTAVLMREHGVARICTRDADFRRFSFLEVVERRPFAPHRKQWPSFAGKIRRLHAARFPSAA